MNANLFNNTNKFTKEKIEKKKPTVQRNRNNSLKTF